MTTNTEIFANDSIENVRFNTSDTYTILPNIYCIMTEKWLKKNNISYTRLRLGNCPTEMDKNCIFLGREWKARLCIKSHVNVEDLKKMTATIVTKYFDKYRNGEIRYKE